MLDASHFLPTRRSCISCRPPPSPPADAIEEPESLVQLLEGLHDEGDVDLTTYVEVFQLSNWLGEALAEGELRIGWARRRTQIKPSAKRERIEAVEGVDMVDTLEVVDTVDAVNTLEAVTAVAADKAVTADEVVVADEADEVVVADNRDDTDEAVVADNRDDTDEDVLGKHNGVRDFVLVNSGIMFV